jgi:hypothetical protein
MGAEVHYFRIEDATKYGVEKAVLLQNLRYWLDKAKANGDHEHDGYHWVYNSAEAFAKLFPYLNAKKISRLLKELEDDGEILSGNYNESAYNRTKWYSMPEYSISQNLEMESQEVGNQFPKYGHSLTYNNPDNNPDNNPLIEPTPLCDAFDVFWNAGLRKVGKPKAESAFLSNLKKTKLSPDAFAAMLADDIKLRLAAKQFGFDKLHPTTYLNQRRWDDDKPDIIPFAEIAEAYHRNLPSNAPVAAWSERRTEYVTQLWHQCSDQTVGWFDRYFSHAAKFPRYNGAIWADFEWLVNPNNYPLVVEGARGAAA